MQKAADLAESARHARGKSGSGRTTVIWFIGTLLVVGLGATGWVGYQALTAKNSLEAAKGLIGTVKTQAAAADFAGIAQSAELLSDHTGTAVAAAHDPLWQAGEYVPVLGKNLTAVREMAEVVDSIAKGTVEPLASVAGGLSPESLKPVDGRINIEPIVQLSAAFGPAAEAFHSAVERGAAIDVDGTVGPVQDAGAELVGMLTSADDLIGSAASVIQIAPELLGANGPRTYVLMFQNLAEATALGGSSAALTEINVDNGAVAIGRQASSGDFPWRDKEGKGGPIVAPDPAVEDIYGPLMYTRLNLAPSRPDFPTAATIAKEFWQQHIGGNVDAVVSIDPVALAHILRATGPIAMSTGDQLSSDNAVRLLLNEVYFRYQGDDIPLSDAFFAEAAKSVFDSLMSPTTDMPQLVAAMAQSIGEHRILAWSPNPEVQATLERTPLSGVLPADNETQTTTGVFFRDMSASKMDYYLETAAALDTDVCTAESPTFTTTVDLRSTITPELAATLPAYIASAPWGGDKFRTQVFVYGPPGATLADATVVTQGVETTFDKSANDLGRPVAVFSVYLAPGETSQVVATFNAPAGSFGPADLRVTPMLIPTATTVSSPGCS
ncbi:hypothetical protein AWU67_12665 [Microterricola viridarii]|uniref:DUF4012 domain-containing protein n=2 Tax=Microterricola viridarii TaxID=412690 RepID=A0A0X8E534_9MICO|nr:hypothetical protein AWU67_12665 [Microterricola viridarii]